MNNPLNLSELMSETNGNADGRLGLFALLSLGICESLASGTLGATEAIRIFFNAENCLHVRKKLGDETADEIMSRGVQLQDLFDALPEGEGQKEFQRELEAIRSLCLRLFEEHQLVA